MNRNDVIREKNNIKNSVLDYIGWTGLVTCEEWGNAISKNPWMLSACKKKRGKTSKFVNAGTINWNEREED